MAIISACVSGWPAVSLRLCPRAMISLLCTTTAPMGTSPFPYAFFASSNASFMNTSWSSGFCIHYKLSILDQVGHTVDDEIGAFQLLPCRSAAQNPHRIQPFLFAEHCVGIVVTDHHNIIHTVGMPFQKRPEHSEIRLFILRIVSGHDIIDQFTQSELPDEKFRTFSGVARDDDIFILHGFQ